MKLIIILNQNIKSYAKTIRVIITSLNIRQDFLLLSQFLLVNRLRNKVLTLKLSKIYLFKLISY